MPNWALKDGYSWNPLRKYPVNENCWCGSGKKAKKCCLPIQPEAVESRLVPELKLMLESSLEKVRQQQPVKGD